MTEKDINIYNNSKIYTIRCRTDNNLIYVGSTTQPLHKRWYGHKSRVNDIKENHILLYKTMNELGIDNFYIELYENYSCNSKEELNRYEGEIIRKIGNLNHIIAGRKPDEYFEENKELLKDKRAEYYNENKEMILENRKKYREDNKDKIKEMKSKYYVENKEAIKEKRNKDKTIKERKTPFYICGCGMSVSGGHKARHETTKKHINFSLPN